MTGRTGYEIREGSQMIRERIRAAVGPCAGVCPERHADLIAEQVLRAKRTSRAAALARQDGTRRLRVKGA